MSASARVIPTGVSGLDLVLGGGVRVLRRLEGAEASATLVLRGPPGSGKTLLGMQVAAALASALEGDVVCGCVELLPLELEAQLASIGLSGLTLPVLSPPFPPGERGQAVRVYGAVLDVGGAGEEELNLEGAVSSLLAAVRAASGRPRVLVLDSLSDGYRLGAMAPRELADAICKFAAEQGLVLVMMEETIDLRPSGWSFASDIVIELGSAEQDQVAGHEGPMERRLTVVKNRLGPSDAGTHYFMIGHGGAEVYPRPSAYTLGWVASRLLPAIRPSPMMLEQDWGVDHIKGTPPPFRTCITAVYGADADKVVAMARSLGLRLPGQGPLAPGIDVHISFGARLPRTPTPQSPAPLALNVLDPYISPAQLLYRAIELLAGAKQELRRVLIGDLRALLNHRDPEGIRQALGMLASLLRQRQVPVVLFETTEVQYGFVIKDATVAGLADVILKMRNSEAGPSSAPSWNMIDLRNGVELRYG